MGRYFYWLFPILRYGHQRREVSAWRAWGTVVAIILLPAAIDFVRLAVPMALAGRFIANATALLDYRIGFWGKVTVITALVLSTINAIELGVALLFVRHRPGRRRPLCTRQTTQFVALGSQTWVILAIVAIGIGLAIAAFVTMPKSDRGIVWVMTGIGTAILATLLVTIGATAVQAALAVIALQDDRRCEQCGYFLIGLTLPRCPECGTPFHPGKLAGLAQAADGEGKSSK